MFRRSTVPLTALFVLLTDCVSFYEIKPQKDPSEAARAGEAGKGFAVVAREISTLGTRTQDNARAIVELISRAVEASASSRSANEKGQTSFESISRLVVTSTAESDRLATTADSQQIVSEKVAEQFAGIITLADQVPD